MLLLLLGFTSITKGQIIPKKLEYLDEKIRLIYTKILDSLKVYFLDALNIKARIYTSEQCKDYHKAKQIYEFRLQEAIRLNAKEPYWVDYYTNTAINIYERMGGLPKATVLFLKAVDILDSLKSNDYGRYVDVYGYLAHLHYNSKNYIKANSY